MLRLSKINSLFWFAALMSVGAGCAATSAKVGQAHDVETASNAAIVTGNKVNPYVAGFIKEVQGRLENKIAANRDANTKNIGEVNRRIENGDKWNTRMQTAIIGCALLERPLHNGIESIICRFRRRKKKRDMRELNVG